MDSCACLLHRARERLVRLAKQHGVGLRQSYTRVGKFALIRQQRYAHAKQFKRTHKALRTLRTMLGRVIRDITRKVTDNAALRDVFALPLSLARRVREQRPRQRGPKVYSLHALEVECIGKGKTHRPYEFGVKVSVATPLMRCKGGQFVAHVSSLPGNPYDGHTLATVIPAMEAQNGSTLSQVVTAAIKRVFRRRAAVEPVIGHLKAEHRMGRNHLAHRSGDASNAILAAGGYNIASCWPGSTLCCACFTPQSHKPRRQSTDRMPQHENQKNIQSAFFIGDYLTMDIQISQIGWSAERRRRKLPSLFSPAINARAHRDLECPLG